MKKEIKTVGQLRATYPELTQQIIDEAVLKEEIRAVQDERRRILGLASIHFGRDAAEKFGRIIKVFSPPDN